MEPTLEIGSTMENGALVLLSKPGYVLALYRAELVTWHVYTVPPVSSADGSTIAAEFGHCFPVQHARDAARDFITR